MLSARITRLRASEKLKNVRAKGSSSGRESVSNVDNASSPYFPSQMSSDSHHTSSEACSEDANKPKKAAKRHITPSYDEKGADSKYTNIMTPTLRKVFKFDNSVVRPPKSTWQPEHWKEQLDNIYEMRKKRDAPVDVMGCQHLGDKDAKPEVCCETVTSMQYNI